MQRRSTEDVSPPNFSERNSGYYERSSRLVAETESYIRRSSNNNSSSSYQTSNSTANSSSGASASAGDNRSRARDRLYRNGTYTGAQLSERNSSTPSSKNRIASSSWCEVSATSTNVPGGNGNAGASVAASINVHASLSSTPPASTLTSPTGQQRNVYGNVASAVVDVSSPQRDTTAASSSLLLSSRASKLNKLLKTSRTGSESPTSATANNSSSPSTISSNSNNLSSSINFTTTTATHTTSSSSTGGATTMSLSSINNNNNSSIFSANSDVEAVAALAKAAAAAVSNSDTGKSPDGHATSSPHRQRSRIRARGRHSRSSSRGSRSRSRSSCSSSQRSSSSYASSHSHTSSPIICNEGASALNSDACTARSTRKLQSIVATAQGNSIYPSGNLSGISLSSSSSNSSCGSNSILHPITHSDDNRPLVIRVRNLPLRSSDTSLKDGLFHEYKKHGKVKWVKVVGQSTDRYALVCFKKHDDVVKSLEVSRDKLFFGCKIDVEPYEGYDVDDNESRPYEAELDEYHPKATRTLFIGNLDIGWTQTELRSHFEPFGEIIEVEIKKQGINAYAFCQYADIVSVVKAIRQMDGEHLGGNRVKLGFGKSMPTNCVWIDGVSEKVTEKNLQAQFSRYGNMTNVVIDRTRQLALIQYDQIQCAQTAVKEMRGKELRGRKLQVDFASRECQDAFYRKLEAQTTTTTRFARYESTTRSRASSFSRHQNSNDGCSPSHTVSSNSSSSTISMVNVPTVPSAIVAGASSNLPSLACVVVSPSGSTTPGRSRLARSVRQTVEVDCLDTRRFRSCDEYSQGSAASHDDEMPHSGAHISSGLRSDSPLLSRLGPIVNQSLTGGETLEVTVNSGNGRRRCDKSPSKTKGDMRTVQKERSHLLDNSVECPSSGDESTSKRCKLDFHHHSIDSGCGSTLSHPLDPCNNEQLKLNNLIFNCDAPTLHESPSTTPLTPTITTTRKGEMRRIIDCSNHKYPAHPHRRPSNDPAGRHTALSAPSPADRQPLTSSATHIFKRRRLAPSNSAENNDTPPLVNSVLIGSNSGNTPASSSSTTAANDHASRGRGHQLHSQHSQEASCGESADGSRPGTPLCDERPEVVPSEPRGLPRERPREIMSLPIPKFGIAWLQQYLKTTNALRYHPPTLNSLSGTTSSMSSVQSNASNEAKHLNSSHPPPSGKSSAQLHHSNHFVLQQYSLHNPKTPTTLAGGIASMSPSGMPSPLRSRSLSSDSSDDDATGKDLAERIRYLDERYENWRSNSANTNVSSSFSKIRHDDSTETRKSSNFDMNSTPMSDIAMTVLSRKSLFDNDYERLKMNQTIESAVPDLSQFTKSMVTIPIPSPPNLSTVKPTPLMSSIPPSLRSTSSVIGRLASLSPMHSPQAQTSPPYSSPTQSPSVGCATVAETARPVAPSSQSTVAIAGASPCSLNLVPLPGACSTPTTTKGLQYPFPSHPPLPNSAASSPTTNPQGAARVTDHPKQPTALQTTTSPDVVKQRTNAIVKSLSVPVSEGGDQAPESRTLTKSVSVPGSTNFGTIKVAASEQPSSGGGNSSFFSSSTKQQPKDEESAKQTTSIPTISPSSTASKKSDKSHRHNHRSDNDRRSAKSERSSEKRKNSTASLQSTSSTSRIDDDLSEIDEREQEKTERERQEREKLEKEKQEKQSREKERQEREKREKEARKQQEREEREQREREEKEREREEKERKERERDEKERKQREREEREREEKERKLKREQEEREEKERKQREREERDRKDKEERERKEKEEHERKEREERKAKEEGERREREETERRERKSQEELDQHESEIHQRKSEGSAERQNNKENATDEAEANNRRSRKSSHNSPTRLHKRRLSSQDSNHGATAQANESKRIRTEAQAPSHHNSHSTNREMSKDGHHRDAAKDVLHRDSSKDGHSKDGLQREPSKDAKDAHTKESSSSQRSRHHHQRQHSGSHTHRSHSTSEHTPTTPSAEDKLKPKDHATSTTKHKSRHHTSKPQTPQAQPQAQHPTSQLNHTPSLENCVGNTASTDSCHENVFHPETARPRIPNTSDDEVINASPSTQQTTVKTSSSQHRHREHSTSSHHSRHKSKREHREKKRHSTAEVPQPATPVCNNLTDEEMPNMPHNPNRRSSATGSAGESSVGASKQKNEPISRKNSSHCSQEDLSMEELPLPSSEPQHTPSSRQNSQQKPVQSRQIILSSADSEDSEDDNEVGKSCRNTKYVSMYDKVKARSCKNMPKPEADETIKAKFSQLKQSRAKRVEKKRSTSYDGDSDSEFDENNQRSGGSGSYRARNRSSSDDVVDTHDEKRRSSQSSTQLTQRMFSDSDSGGAEAEARRNKLHYNLMRLCDADSTDGEEERNSPSKRITQKRHSYTSRIASDSESQPQSATETAAGKCVNTNECDTKDVKPIKKELMINQNSDFEHKSSARRSSISSVEDQKIVIKSEHADLMSKSENYTYFGNALNIFDYNMQQAVDLKVEQEFSPETRKKHKKSKRRQKTPTSSISLDSPQGMVECKPYIGAKVLSTNELPKVFDPFDELKRDTSLVSSLVPVIPQTPTNHDASDTSASERKRHKERRERKRDKLKSANDASGSVDLDKSLKEERQRLKKSKKSKSLDVMRTSSVPTTPSISSFYAKSNEEKMEDIFGPISDESEFSDNEFKAASRAPSPATPSNAFMMANISTPNTALMMDSITTPLSTAASVESHCKQEQLNPYKQEPLTPKSHTVEENEENKQKLFTDQNENDHRARKERRDKKRKEREQSRETHALLSFQQPKHIDDENSVDLDAAGRALEAQLMEDCDNKTTEDATPSTATTYHSNTTDAFRFSDGDENSVELLPSDRVEVLEDSAQKSSEEVSTTNDLEVAPNELQECHQYKDKKKKKKRSKDEKHHHHHHQRRESSSSATSSQHRHHHHHHHHQHQHSALCPKANKQSAEPGATSSTQQFPCKEHAADIEGPPQVQISNPSPSLPCLIGDDDIVAPAIVVNEVNSASTVDRLSISPMREQQMISPIPNTPTVGHGMDYEKPKSPAPPTATQLSVDVTPLPATQPFSPTTDSNASSMLSSPHSSTSNKKKPEIFIPGFDGELDEKISESAVQSISAEFNSSIVDHHGDEPKIPIESPPDATKHVEKIENTKSRVTISQEETESAVSALLGESFGNSSDFSFVGVEGLDDMSSVDTTVAPAEPDEEAALAAQAIETATPQPSEDCLEVSNAVQSLTNAEIDIKADTPQSERELQIDTDNEDNVYVAESNANNLKIDENVLDSLEETLSSEREEVKDKISDHELQSTCSAPTVITKIELESSPNQPKIQADTADTNVTKAIELQTEQPQPVLPSMMSLDTATVVHEDKTSPVAPADILVNESRSALTEQAPKLTIEPSTITLPSSPADFPPPQALLSPRGNGSNEMAKFSPQQHGDFVNVQSPQMSAGSPRGNTPTPQLQSQVIPNQRVPLSPQPQLLQTTGMPLTNHSSPMPCPTTTANVGPLIQRINATTVSKPVDGQQPKANNFALPSRSNHNQQLPPKSVIEQLSSQSHMMPLTVQKLPPVPSHPAIISKIVNVQPHQATLTEFYQGKPMFATAPTHQNPPTQLHEFQKSTAPSSPRQQQPFQQQKMVLQERPRQLHGNANVSGQHPVILQNHFAGNPVSTYMAHPNAKEKLHPPTTEHLEVSHSERKKCPKPIINELLAVIEMEEAAKSIKAKANKLQEDATLVAVAQKLNSVAEAVSVIRSPTPTNGGKNSIIGKDFRFLLTEENIKKIAPPKDEVEHDSKEDSDYWSAKEANIETVLKKVDEVDEIKPKIAQKSSMEEILPLTDLQSSNNTTKAAEQSQEEPKIKSEGCNFPSAPNVVSDEKPQWKVESIGVTFNHQPQVSTQSAADNDTEDETETKQLQDAEHVPVHPAGVERMVPRGAMAKRGRTSRGGRKQNAGITVAPASAVVQPDVGVQTRLRKPATAPVATRGRKGRPPRNVVTQQQQQQQQQQTTPQLPQHGYPQPNQVTVGAGIVISPHVLTAAEKKARSQSAASTSAAEDSDIYEFHEDSGEESKTASAQTNPAAKGDARPRLILTIKSPGQTQPIVKTHVKPAAPLAALSVTVTDNAGPTSQVQTTDKTAIQRAPSSEPMAPEASSLPAVLSPGNTRKSRRLLEKDRSTVDDIIDAVVRNTQTSSTDGAAASPQKPAEVHPRRSGRNANGKKADASPNAATTVVRLRRSKDRKSSVDSVPSVGDTASDTEKVGAHESQAVSQVKPLIEPISRGVSEERNYQPSERHFNDSSQLPMNHIVVNEKDQTTVSIPQPQQMQPQPQLQVQQQNQAQAQQQYQEQDQSQQQPHQKQHQPQQQSHSQQQLQQQQQVQQQSHQQQQPLQLQHHPNAPIQHQAQPQNQPHQQLVSHHPFPTTMHPKKKVLMSAEIDSLAAVNSAIPSAGHPILHSAAPASQKTTGGAADAANKALIDPVTGMISGMQQGKEGNLPSATAAAASQTHRTPTNPKKKIQAAVAAAAAAENALHSDVRQHMSPIQNKMAAPIATPITTLTKPVQIEAAAAMLTKPAGMINKPVGVVLKSSTAPLVIQQIIPPQGGVTKQPIVVQQSPVGMQAQVSNARPKSLKAHVLNHQKINQQQYQQPQQQQQQPQQQQQMPSISQQQQGLSHVIQSNIIGRQQLTTGQQQQLLVIPPTHSPHGAAQLNSPRLHHQQQPQLVIKQGQAVPQTQQQLLHIVSSKTAVNHANKQQQVYTGPTQQQLAVMQMEQGLQQQHAKSMAVQQQQQHLSKQQVAAPVAHQQQLPAKQQHKLQQATTMVLQPGIIGLPPHMILQSKTPLHLQPHQLTPSPPLQQGKGTPGVHNLQTQSGPIITSISSPPPTAAHKQQQPAGVTGPSNLRTSIPAISPQGQARVTPLLLPSGMPLTPYEASLHDIGGYSVTSIGQSPPPAHQQASPITPGDPSFAAGALRGVSPRDHYMLYHPLLRTQEHNNSLQFEEKILGSSPPLELRRPASVTRTITVPHSLQSPQDRTSDSPQAAQVYVHNSRIPHPYSEIASRVFYESGRPISIEPPPAHRSTPHNVVAPPPVVVPPSGTGSTSPFIGAPGVQPPPSTPTSASTAAHMHPKLIERERERGRDREQALERERERELNQQRRDNEQLNARTVNSPQQRPNQVASPQGDSLLTLLQRYPVMWQGLLALKTDQAAVQMHFVFGNPHVARMSLPCNSDGSTPPLRIAQRMRLEQTQLEGVAKKMQFENEHCILLALPCGRDHADVLLQSRNLQTGFITYMQQKAAAGIVNIPLANSDQAAYVVHIFPSCDFANENLERAAPDLKNRVAEIAHLLIVIATV